MIFVDTGAWFAAFVPNDFDHPAADAWLNSNNDVLLTTDYVIDELLTLMKCRGEYDRAIKIGELLLTGSIARIEWLTIADVQVAWTMFCRYRDKDWSFTDCTSRAVMERLSISTAFAFDEHFRQFGNIHVVPGLA